MKQLASSSTYTVSRLIQQSVGATAADQTADIYRMNIQTPLMVSRKTGTASPSISGSTFYQGKSGLTDYCYPGLLSCRHLALYNEFKYIRQRRHL